MRNDLLTYTINLQTHEFNIMQTPGIANTAFGCYHTWHRDANVNLLTTLVYIKRANQNPTGIMYGTYIVSRHLNWHG